ncbi:hybrid sensor histidine kinase/response regulator [Segetibacter aerophilus]|uniref:histidine kinase n=1 Tax=Segetibacter aerophilus TaxID=670293 RepID=A0A512BJZ2_9BACT|nr:hybrid sensor histidine kinase/response regulator [Segetibacter aerophilus]GEO12282.1 hybrid sensor histidine kinase/response regulator [Segetibacter aerophilus]
MFTAERKISVLYVDDEEDNLLSFKAAFRRKFQVFTAISAAEGLRMLNEHPISVIIADQRMPKSTGVEFFNIVRVAHPYAIRMLLTGYADLEAVIDAINKGQIFRYIKKPWNELEVEMAIKNAYEVFTTKLQLKNKVHELERTNDELNKFVYSTSHDLRSPLVAIMGVLNLAKMEESVIDPNGYMAMIETCVNKMDFFILKVIEYYKSNRVEEVIELVDLKAICDDIIELSRIQNPAVNFHVIMKQEQRFYSDSFRLSVVLNNLLSNAVKYQKAEELNPEVKVIIDVQEMEANIIIEDNGVGIINDHLDNIFKMFFRSHSTAIGLGIGLHIVKEALTRMGGEITVESTLGIGTRFSLKLPNKK